MAKYNALDASGGCIAWDATLRLQPQKQALIQPPLAAPAVRVKCKSMHPSFLHAKVYMNR